MANLRPQPAETSGFDVADHVTALQDHGVSIDTVVADISYVALGDVGGLGVTVVVAELAKANGLRTTLADWRTCWPIWSHRGGHEKPGKAGRNAGHDGVGDMTVRIGINGFGRIGRNVLRASGPRTPTWRSWR